MLPVLDQLLGTFFEHLKNIYLTWIASVDKKVADFRKLGVVDSAKFAYSRRFALVPCTVYLVDYFLPRSTTKKHYYKMKKPNTEKFVKFVCKFGRE